MTRVGLDVRQDDLGRAHLTLSPASLPEIEVSFSPEEAGELAEALAGGTMS